MPRKARLDAPGVMRHVIIRGIDQRKIFRDDWDREDLLQRLSNLMPATQTPPAILARRFEQRASTATYACQRGEQMAIKQDYQFVSHKN